MLLMERSPLPYFSLPSEDPGLSLLYTIWIFEDLQKKWQDFFLCFDAVLGASLKSKVGVSTVTHPYSCVSMYKHVLWFEKLLCWRVKVMCQNWDGVILVFLSQQTRTFPSDKILSVTCLKRNSDVLSPVHFHHLSSTSFQLLDYWTI